MPTTNQDSPTLEADDARLSHILTQLQELRSSLTRRIPNATMTYAHSEYAKLLIDMGTALSRARKWLPSTFMLAALMLGTCFPTHAAAHKHHHHPHMTKGQVLTLTAIAGAALAGSLAHYPANHPPTQPTPCYAPTPTTATCTGRR